MKELNPISITPVRVVVLFLAMACMSACDFMLGTRQDDTVDEIFEQGAIDPTAVQSVVGYVPVLPVWDQFMSPTDVWVGYDEMVYVTDAQGVHVLDLKGERFQTIPIPGATKVTQDLRLHTYVLGRVDTLIDSAGIPVRRNLAAVYVLERSATAQPVFLDTLVHPFNDLSRSNTNFRGRFDEQVQYTGIACLGDHGFYLARRGPSNNTLSAAAPDHAVLVFRPDRSNNGYVPGLNPSLSGLKSAMAPSGLCGLMGPPQLVFGMNPSRDFILLQSATQAEYKALWIRSTENPEVGTLYSENQTLVQFDRTKASRFLYEPFRFTAPADVCVAPDETGYLFVVDAVRDSLYQFTSKGYEGVNPPPSSGLTRQVRASFGGRGSGPFQFHSPSGVAYFRRTVYVADKGNHRIMRYKLSSDLER
ncbi:MAG: hypothetical protein FJ350_04165 [Sphingomonadales bacterium]|nr:hypothetical protein [Sphingomonadales bacterium]MBM3923947.1 hypothetical protein [Sphingomonadales bacterium]